MEDWRTGSEARSSRRAEQGRNELIHANICGLEVSVVIPAYNEQERIGPTLEGLTEYLDSLGISFEILVADDGSTDRTRALAMDFPDQRIKVAGLGSNRGKGAALRAGIAKTSGKYVFFVDADLPYALDFMERALQQLRSGQACAVIGARDLPESSYDSSYPRLRVFTGRVFSHIVGLLLRLRIYDTQCGFKGFRGESVRKAALFAQADGYTIDIELLLILRLWRQPIRTLAVHLRRHHGSKVRLIRDSAAMLRDLLRIRRSRGRGEYPSACPKEGLLSVACPVDDESRFTVFALVDDRFRFCRCRRCGTLYQNPRPDEASIAELYQQEYFQTSNVRSGYLNYMQTLPEQRRTAAWIWDCILGQGAVPPQGKVLDVGCGSGVFLEEAARRGLEPWGNDFCALREKADFRFVEGDFLTCDLPLDAFHAVVFNDSFEHFTEPRAPLLRSCNLLKPGGLVVINTPDPDSPMRKLSGRGWTSLKHEHLMILPRQGLESLLRDSGFTPLSRRPSRQFADWSYLAPRLDLVSTTLRKMLALPGRWMLGKRAIRVPTGGMLVIAAKPTAAVSDGGDSPANG